MNKTKYHIMLSGGGTGGHIFPAIAIADELKRTLPNADFMFVGATGRMEMEKVPQAGYYIVGLWISGLQRRMTLSNLLFPIKLISSTLKVGTLIKQFNPDVVIGTGGYASGALLRAASKKKIPTLILEQNSYPGLTNKLLSRTVDSICVAYPDMERYFPKDKITVTGSPIRKEIMQMKTSKEDACLNFGLRPTLPVLLIIGGSQGAQKINEAIAANLPWLLKENIQILWQSGKNGYKEALDAATNADAKNRIVVKEFIQRMDLAYASCDLIVSRAGAIAIAEIIAVKKPAIYIPLPSAAEDHQTRNAQTLVDQNAGILVKESDAQNLIGKEIIRLMKNEGERLKIAKNMTHFDHHNATKSIVEQVMKLLENSKK
ncbi:MAG: undecaprenyldiphospho-muramoylpentapeptide beta-N-acetylglucosaminyltransferase [Bacteroidales bacterium]